MRIRKSNSNIKINFIWYELLLVLEKKKVLCYKTTHYKLNINLCYVNIPNYKKECILKERII